MDKHAIEHAKHDHQDPRALGHDHMRSQNAPRPVDFGAFKNRVAGKGPMNVNWYRKAPKHS